MPAIRYVDGVNGSDSNNGLSIGTAWKTFEKGFNDTPNASDGSVCYVAAGDYVLSSDLQVTDNHNYNAPKKMEAYLDQDVRVNRNGKSIMATNKSAIYFHGIEFFGGGPTRLFGSTNTTGGGWTFTNCKLGGNVGSEVNLFVMNTVDNQWSQCVFNSANERIQVGARNSFYGCWFEGLQQDIIVVCSGTGITFSRCFFVCDNGFSGRIANINSVGIKFENCVFYGGMSASTIIQSPTAGRELTFRNCVFEDFVGRPFTFGSDQLVLEGNKFYRCDFPLVNGRPSRQNTILTESYFARLGQPAYANRHSFFEPIGSPDAISG